MAKISLIRSYVGSKVSVAEILKCFIDKKCNNYYEVFAGAAGLFFSMWNGLFIREYLNEISIDIAALYYALTQVSTKDRTVNGILSLVKPDDLNIGKKQFMDAFGKIRGRGPKKLSEISDEELIEIAVNSYLVYSQSMNCSGKGYSSLKKNQQYQNEVRQNLEYAMSRLDSKPEVTCMDAFEILNDYRIINNPKNQIMLDPPYCGVYRDNLSGTDYIADMASLNNHIQLCECIKDTKAAVILCGYRSDNPDIPNIYDAVLGSGWKCFLIEESYNNCNIMGKGKKKRRKREFVWTNREPDRLVWSYISHQNFKQDITIGMYWDKIKSAIINKEISYYHAVEYNRSYNSLYLKELVTKDSIDCLKRRG